MKRSEINQLIADAVVFFDAHGWSLPPWALWAAGEFRRQPDLAQHLRQHQMGWDVTDFGGGNFPQRGLLLFCLRNGVAGHFAEKPYAEKLMVVQEGQETPLHYHRAKMEDIINRAGGNLMLEFFATDPSGISTAQAVSVRVDGALHQMQPGAPLRLRPGQSVTIPHGTMHRFYAEQGAGRVLAGEVSQCNDDLLDNFFLEDVGRFSAIEEDEAVRFPLWNEVAWS